MSQLPLLEQFAAIVGSSQVLTGPDTARYVIDGRGAGGATLAVVRPATTEQVSAVVRACAEAQVRLIPQGARTGLVGAGLPDDTGTAVVLSLERLNAILEIDAVNRSATVEAGALLSKLNERAGRHGLFFPIDLGADPSIGGMVAANTGGARLIRYGDVRRNLLALEVVLADVQGTVVRLGAPLWKNNAGLDLKQLWVGSSGSLGVVTGATVALQPLPGAAVAALLAFENTRAVTDVLMAMEQAFGPMLSAFEGMSGAAIEAAIKHVPRVQNPLSSVPPFAVLLEVSAGAAFGTDVLEERVASVLEPFLGAADAVVDAVIDRNGGLWTLRHSIPEGLRASGRVVACDIALRRSDVMEFREDMRTTLAAECPGLIGHDFGHIGDGGLHFNLVWPHGSGEMPAGLGERARELIFSCVVQEYGGSFSAEHGIGPRNADWYSRFVPAPDRRLAGRVQRMLAPEQIGRVDFRGHDTWEPRPRDAGCQAAESSLRSCKRSR